MTPENFANLAGSDLGASRWFDMPQGRVDQFADVTEDWQFIHLDAEKAAESAFGGTVAHGYLTLSMLSAMAYDVLPDLDGMSASVNYGFDKIRFLAPVRTGSRLRAHFGLEKVDRKAPNRLLAHLSVSMEIEGQDTPAIVADWLVMYLFDTEI